MLRRLQKLTCVLLVIMTISSTVLPAMAASVSATVKTTSAKLYSKASASGKSIGVKKGAKVTVTAVRKGWAKVKCGGKTGYMRTSTLSKTNARTTTLWKSKVIKMDWFDGGSYAFRKGSYATIYDIKTHKSIRIKRMGGVNHADVEPATKADTAKLWSLEKGYSWDSRPVILYTDGKYIACAINTEPHGDQTILTNGYNGQFCLHMVGSKTHGSDSVNEEHQKSIVEAYNWAH